MNGTTDRDKIAGAARRHGWSVMAQSPTYAAFERGPMSVQLHFGAGTGNVTGGKTIHGTSRPRTLPSTGKRDYVLGVLLAEGDAAGDPETQLFRALP